MGKFSALLEKVGIEDGSPSASDLGAIPTGNNPKKDKDEDLLLYGKDEDDEIPLYRKNYNPIPDTIIPLGTKDDGRYKGPHDNGKDDGIFLELPLQNNGLGGDGNDVDGTFRTRPRLDSYGQTGGLHGEVPITYPTTRYKTGSFIQNGESMSKFGELSKKVCFEGLSADQDPDTDMSYYYQDNKDGNNYDYDDDDIEFEKKMYSRNHEHGDYDDDDENKMYSKNKEHSDYDDDDDKPHDSNDDEVKMKTVIRDGKKIRVPDLKKGQKRKLSKATRMKISRSRKKSQKVKKAARSVDTKRKRAKSLKVRKQTIK